ncbi:MAG: 3-phosphoshikimate 1-carboxyvinyltransferase [Marvinbryantia sp.]|jgi:3-phosphoshikimate 1-carboxyvinyltransferase
MKFTRQTCPLRGELTVPGDKSISHRAVMFGALARGTTEVTNFLQGADCLSTIDCFRRLGIEIDITPEKILVHGKGLHGLQAPLEMLDTGNSGTTTRLISGILAGQCFETILNGDSSIQSRPMKRIMEPLAQMGADIVSINGNGCAPLRIRPAASLHGISYQSPVASAQVKSCILLAGLYADTPTSVTEPQLSRNHTELMLSGFGADVRTEGNTAVIRPEPDLRAMKLKVPGDISSAAYFIAAALTVPDSELLIKNVGINPTRDGILRVLREMGADISLQNKKISGGEPTADLLVKYSSLKGTIIGGALIPTLIDELPVIAVLAALAEGTTIIRDAAELKVKESNRIDTVAAALTAMGAHVQATDDGMIINGGYPLHGAVVDSHLDHRIAMSFAVAALAADGETEITGAGCVRISYPDFYETLHRLK